MKNVQRVLKELSSHEMPRKLSLIAFLSLGSVELKLETDTEGFAATAKEGRKRKSVMVLNVTSVRQGCH